ncbi:divergent polysaccharide deacetylase family protein [Natroniella sulfidigena]|uniref:divergent polysaccharide deacetylase family protein n=1 Tax=Natroniella sulfidigena TaxID=723921 RepID=UPI00200A1B73|nr:divergent polysaccharide deacetylase family protein [Natroniella sulfidigena]MCK8817242.1 divergent polysaccharide deacetylase family protein [Natroniella sulfidigena]
MIFIIKGKYLKCLLIVLILGMFFSFYSYLTITNGEEEELLVETVKNNVPEDKLIENIGYQEGVLYLDLATKVEEFKIIEQFFLVESLLTTLADLPQIEYIQFLIAGEKKRISPYLNLKKPIKPRHQPAQIAIVIDDFGNRAEGTEGMLNLEQKITTAIMPFEKRTQQEAKEAIAAGFDVIIHLPMEPNNGKRSWLGPKPIMTTLSNEEIKERMKDAIADIPQAIGFNNHTGSKATADKRVVKAVLEVAKENDLIAIDSRTSPDSVIGELGEQLDVPVLTRDLFLDLESESKQVEEAVLTLVGMAIKEGEAIGIGHVGPQGGAKTLAILERLLPELDNKGIEFIGVSDLVDK